MNLRRGYIYTCIKRQVYVILLCTGERAGGGGGGGQGRVASRTTLFKSTFSGFDCCVFCISRIITIKYFPSHMIGLNEPCDKICPILTTFQVLGEYLSDNKHNMCKNMLSPFLGHNLYFQEENSFLWSLLLETVCLLEQIMSVDKYPSSIFSCHNYLFYSCRILPPS